MLTRVIGLTDSALRGQYLRSCGTCRRNLEHIAETRTAEILRSFTLQDAHVRYEAVAHAHPETFEWLFNKKVGFADWLLSDNNQAFWIQGKPGSGKSTLMKFAMRHPKMTVYLDQV